jgi:hypothetical protein
MEAFRTRRKLSAHAVVEQWQSRSWYEKGRRGGLVVSKLIETILHSRVIIAPPCAKVLSIRISVIYLTCEGLVGVSIFILQFFFDESNGCIICKELMMITILCNISKTYTFPKQSNCR